MKDCRIWNCAICELLFTVVYYVELTVNVEERTTTRFEVSTDLDRYIGPFKTFFWNDTSFGNAYGIISYNCLKVQ